VPADVTEVAEGLMYRDFITVGLLASKRLAVKEKDGSPAQRQLDLYPGTRCRRRPPADLQ
jgi:hypothetical protein